MQLYGSFFELYICVFLRVKVYVNEKRLGFGILPKPNLFASCRDDWSGQT